MHEELCDQTSLGNEILSNAKIYEDVEDLNILCVCIYCKCPNAEAYPN